MRTRGFTVYVESEPALRLQPPATASFSPSTPTANERFRSSLWPRFRIALLPVVAFHYAVLSLSPSFAAAKMTASERTLVAVELLPRVKIPDTPPPVARPARPRLAAIAVSEQVTIAPMAFEAVAQRGEALPPPPVAREDTDRPHFIPFLVPPRLKNEAATIALLRSVYPPRLRQAGIGGTVRLWIQIDNEGAVLDCRIDTSSGFRELDDAALIVARATEWVPAVTPNDEPRVWIALPIVFTLT